MRFYVASLGAARLLAWYVRRQPVWRFQMWFFYFLPMFVSNVLGGAFN